VSASGSAPRRSSGATARQLNRVPIDGAAAPDRGPERNRFRGAQRRTGPLACAAGSVAHIGSVVDNVSPRNPRPPDVVSLPFDQVRPPRAISSATANFVVGGGGGGYSVRCRAGPASPRSRAAGSVLPRRSRNVVLRCARPCPLYRECPRPTLTPSPFARPYRSAAALASGRSAAATNSHLVRL